MALAIGDRRVGVLSAASWCRWIVRAPEAQTSATVAVTSLAGARHQPIQKLAPVAATGDLAASPRSQHVDPTADHEHSPVADVVPLLHLSCQHDRRHHSTLPDRRVGVLDESWSGDSVEAASQTKRPPCGHRLAGAGITEAKAARSPSTTLAPRPLITPLPHAQSRAAPVAAVVPFTLRVSKRSTQPHHAY